MTYLIIILALPLLFILASFVGKMIKRARIEQFGRDPDDDI